MSTLAPLIDAWDEGHREFGIALGGLSDEDLWKRAHPRLLSVGELAAHIAYGQATWIFGEGNYRPELDKLPVQSPLIDNKFSYYLHTVDAPVQLEMGTEAVLEELMRVYGVSRAFVVNREIDDPYPGQWQTWGNLVQYQVFHIAYHTGQAYSVRHLMGHETEDN